MRALLVAVVVLSGCVGELLSPEEVTLRTVSCAFLDPEVTVELVHHASDGVGDDLIQAASASWVAAVAPIVERDLERMSWRVQEAPPKDLEDWMSAQPVLEGPGLRLHVLWLDALESGRTVDETAPGFVAINASAVVRAAEAGHDASDVARALLFHGIGHALGVVNRGVPLHDANGTQREHPMHHEPGGVMAVEWHHVASFPARAETREYSAPLQADWRHAAQEVCP